MKEYSLEEVSKHNNENDLWMIINGYVYDVTGFLNDHPGGRDAFLYNAGKDATTYFNNVVMHGKSEGLAEFMLSLCIGSVKK